MALVVALLAPTAGLATPQEPAEQAQAFATCAGRYAAQAEHEWMRGADGKTARSQRDLFRGLLDAVADDAQAEGVAPSQLIRFRSGAWFAQAQLLQQGFYHVDRKRAARALAQARRQMRVCETLILG
ncbi:MAG: hypothetical protein QNJ09_16175 [Paracoccaceae bacterium]|nr:hypothetical protein [Paracoccaceae bacterium]